MRVVRVVKVGEWVSGREELKKWARPLYLLFSASFWQFKKTISAAGYGHGTYNKIRHTSQTYTRPPQVSLFSLLFYVALLLMDATNWTVTHSLTNKNCAVNTNVRYCTHCFLAANTLPSTMHTPSFSVCLPLALCFRSSLSSFPSLHHHKRKKKTKAGEP